MADMINDDSPGEEYERKKYKVTRKPGQPLRIDSDNGWGNSGVTLIYTKSRDEIDISGWYDGMVGIEGFTITGNELKQILGWD